MEWNWNETKWHTHHAVSARVRSDALLLGVLSAPRAGLLRDDLDPVSVGVEREGDVLHAAVGQPLLEPVAGLLEPPARRLDVVDRDADVSEPAVRLLVSAVDRVVCVRLGPVVVRQLDDALAVRDAVPGRRRRRRVVRQEVQVELRLGELQLLDQAQSQELVELDCRIRLSSAAIPLGREYGRTNEPAGFVRFLGSAYQTLSGP